MSAYFENLIPDDVESEDNELEDDDLGSVRTVWFDDEDDDEDPLSFDDSSLF